MQNYFYVSLCPHCCGLLEPLKQRPLNTLLTVLVQLSEVVEMLTATPVSASWGSEVRRVELIYTPLVILFFLCGTPFHHHHHVLLWWWRSWCCSDVSATLTSWCSCFTLSNSFTLCVAFLFSVRERSCDVSPGVLVRTEIISDAVLKCLCVQRLFLF